MNIESVIIKGVCAISLSLASRGFFEHGNGTMAIITGIAASVTVILFVREILK